MPEEVCTMGCDPELEVREFPSMRPVSANSMGIVAAGPVKYGGSSSYKFGFDGGGGGGSIPELRPLPSTDCHELTLEIAACLKLGYDANKRAFAKCGMYGGSGTGHSIGGHIHIGRRFRDTMTYNLVTLSLNNMFTPIVAKIFNVSNMKKVQRDGTHSYGSCVGEDNVWRAEHQWGFEYRPLPSFIVTPVITYVFLQLAQIVVMEFVDNGNDWFFKGVTTGVANYPKINLDVVLKHIFEETEKLKRFDQLMKKDIWKAFKETVSSGKVLDENTEVLTRWGLRDEAHKLDLDAIRKMEEAKEAANREKLNRIRSIASELTREEGL